MSEMMLGPDTSPRYPQKDERSVAEQLQPDDAEIKSYKIKATLAAVKHVASVPATIDFMPSATTSARRSGHIVPRPPIMMPRLPKLAKPHSAYVSSSRLRSDSPVLFAKSMYATSSLMIVLVPSKAPAAGASCHEIPASQATGASAQPRIPCRV